MVGAQLSPFVAPVLAGYFAHRRRLSAGQVARAAVPFALEAVLVNVYPFGDGAATGLLVAAHLPVALWFAVAYPYLSGALHGHERRMDFV